ncbi:hypothetical protein [Effusibacillus consociatus]|uniref:Uncharacterized protein n=1 Tax=Effusibacillus consociatus TaxID=1117041 RepID=A0ABV9Q2G7_9BACL
MYWGYYPYETVPFYRNYLPYSPDVHDVDDLKQMVDELQNQLEEIRAKINNPALNPEPETRQAAEVEESDLVRDIQQQINSLKAAQIASYEELLSMFLKNEMRDRIRDIQLDITPEKVVKKISKSLDGTKSVSQEE